MEYNFNISNIENILYNKPEIMIFWSFVSVIILLMFSAILAYVFRKLNINRYILESLLWSLIFTFIIGLITIAILYLLEVNGVKLAYIWIIIFTGYFCFSLFHNNSLKKLFKDYSNKQKLNR